MARDTVGRTFLVAGILCVVCSVVVSAAAVGLRGLQDANRQLDIRKNILQVAGLLEEGGDINELYEANVDQQLIDLASGQAADQQVVDAASYNPLDAARDPDYSTAIQPELDVAGIKRRENFAFVYRVMEEGRVSKFILPIYGNGLWSTLSSATSGWGWCARPSSSSRRGGGSRGSSCSASTPSSCRA